MKQGITASVEKNAEFSWNLNKIDKIDTLSYFNAVIGYLRPVAKKIF